MSGDHSKEPPAINSPVSNSPVGPSFGDPAVNVCAAVSGFDIITTSPTLTVAVPGM